MQSKKRLPTNFAEGFSFPSEVLTVGTQIQSLSSLRKVSIWGGGNLDSYPPGLLPLSSLLLSIPIKVVNKLSPYHPWIRPFCRLFSTNNKKTGVYSTVICAKWNGMELFQFATFLLKQGNISVEIPTYLHFVIEMIWTITDVVMIIFHHCDRTIFRYFQLEESL